MKNLKSAVTEWWPQFLLVALLGFLIVASHRVRAETMTASYYHARGYAAAHRSWPVGTHARVCHRKCVVVTIAGRGPFIRGRQLDISTNAARVIGLIAAGVARVDVIRLD